MEKSNNYLQYYLDRAAISRDLAGRAVSAEIAHIHFEFAERYELMVAQLEQSSRASVPKH